MKNKFFRKFIPVLAVFSLLIFFNHYLTDQFLKSSVVEVFKSPLGGSYIYLAGFKNKLVSWFRVDNIILENQFLNQENRRLFSANLKTAELEKENELLRKELGVARKRNWQVEIAKIFQLNNSGEFRTALIDKGSNHGIQPGLAVVFEGDILLGVVKEVFPDSAEIFLINDPRISVSVKSRDSQVFARARGDLNKGMALELITNQENVAIGELFLTSGLDGLPGLLIAGSVSNVKSGGNGLFQNVSIELLFENILPENVFVLKSNGKD